MDDTWWVEHIFALSPADQSNPLSGQVAATIAPADALSLMTRIFINCGSHFKPFTDQQIAEGLVFLGAAGESDWMYHIYNRAVAWQTRSCCIRSLTRLYRDCFARRCRNSVTHLASDANPLNGVCYMWWDRFPSGLPDTTEDERYIVDMEIINVMAEALEIDHDACRESALHGLGHWEPADRIRIRTIVDGWLDRHRDVSPDLLSYARLARDGQVQ